jgi:hypothetical protein
MKPVKTSPTTPSPFAGELEPLAGGDILVKPVEEMTVPERAQSHAILNFLGKRIEARMKLLRDPILKDVQDHGEDVVGTDGKPTGSKKLYVEGTKVYDKKSVGKEPDYQKMSDLLASKSLDIEKAYDKVPTYVYNPSKVQTLIMNGHLKEKDVEDLKKVVHALVVEPAPELAALLEGAAKAAALPEPKK